MKSAEIGRTQFELFPRVVYVGFVLSLGVRLALSVCNKRGFLRGVLCQGFSFF